MLLGDAFVTSSVMHIIPAVKNVSRKIDTN